MKSALLTWQLWALRLPGLQRSRPFSQNVNSDFATFIRTIVIFVRTRSNSRKHWANGCRSTRFPVRSYSFLVLSGPATGGSWVCYFRALKLGDAARVAPIDKMSVVLVAVFGVVFLGERLSVPNWL